MLFSSDSISKTINNSFEPVWVSVREVPIVRIDFGNGNVLTRTLHGNVATYVCNEQGHVLDILPGIYEPNKYSQQLRQFTLMKSWLTRMKRPLESMKEYHTTQAKLLADGKSDQAHRQFRDMSKTTVLAIRRADQSLIVGPRGNVILHAGDIVIVLADETDLSRLRPAG